MKMNGNWLKWMRIDKYRNVQKIDQNGKKLMQMDGKGMEFNSNWNKGVLKKWLEIDEIVM